MKIERMHTENQMEPSRIHLVVFDLVWVLIWFGFVLKILNQIYLVWFHIFHETEPNRTELHPVTLSIVVLLVTKQSPQYIYVWTISSEKDFLC